MFSKNLRTVYASNLFPSQSDIAQSEMQQLAWYALHTNSRQEFRTISNLRAWGIESFTPWIKEKSSLRSAHSAPVLKPLFPRYVFAKFNAVAMLHSVRYTRGVHSVVSSGTGPVIVEDGIIALCRSRMGEDECIREIKAGDAVIITAGPFKDFQGLFERELPGEEERVEILLTTVTYQARVEVDRCDIRRIRFRAAG